MIVHGAGHALAKAVSDWMHATISAPVHTALKEIAAEQATGQPLLNPAPERPVKFHLHRRWLYIGIGELLVCMVAVGLAVVIFPNLSNNQLAWGFVIMMPVQFLLFPTSLVFLLGGLRGGVAVDTDSLHVRKFLFGRRIPLADLAGVSLPEDVGPFGPVVRLLLDDNRTVNFWADMVDVGCLMRLLAYSMEQNQIRREAERQAVATLAVHAARDLTSDVPSHAPVASASTLAAHNPLPNRPWTFRPPAYWLAAVVGAVLASGLLIWGLAFAWDNPGVSSDGLFWFETILVTICWAPAMFMLAAYLQTAVTVTRRQLTFRVNLTSHQLVLEHIRSVARTPEGGLVVTNDLGTSFQIPPGLRSIGLLHKTLDFHALTNGAITVVTEAATPPAAKMWDGA